MNGLCIACRPGAPLGYLVYWMPRLVTDHTFWPVRKTRVYYLLNLRTAEEEEFRDFNVLQKYIKDHYLKHVYYDI